MTMARFYDSLAHERAELFSILKSLTQNNDVLAKLKPIKRDWDVWYCERPRV